MKKNNAVEGFDAKISARHYVPLRFLCDFLVKDDVPVRADLIFVLAGRPERKSFGFELYRRGLAKRLILSVGRFEVRQIAPLGLETQPDVRDLAQKTPPARRHFFVDLSENSSRAVVREGAGDGTFAELCSLGDYLCSETIDSIMVVSTSIHLRRVQFCIRRILAFSGKRLLLVPVPEGLSSFRRAEWWRDADHRRYLCAEYMKLAVYSLRFLNRGSSTLGIVR